MSEETDADSKGSVRKKRRVNRQEKERQLQLEGERGKKEFAVVNRECGTKQAGLKAAE